MIPVAWVSGQAGRAAWPEGDKAVVLCAGESTEYRVPSSAMPKIFANVGDLQQLANTSRDAVALALDLAWRKDRALQLCLLLLDAAALGAARVAAVPALELLLVDGAVSDFAANVLFAAPMPASGDLAGAQELTGSRGARHANSLLRSISASQEEIKFHRRAWNSFSAERFGGAENKRIVEKELVEAGAFRYLAVSNQRRVRDAIQSVARSLDLDADSRSVIELWAARARRKKTAAVWITRPESEVRRQR